MQWVDTLVNYVKDFSTYRTTIGAGDILEILIIAFLVYYILAWMKTTRAWQLLKGLIVICVVLLLAFIMDMSTILWLAENLLSFAVIVIAVVMQPELRHALEQLGKKNFLPSGVFSDASKREQELFSEKTINEIVKASFEMGRARTGALIVIEQNESLRDYERTGIEVDGIVTSQLLINIFEHNTPLHDGAVIVRGNRITSATCYLPLSDNLDLSKELGTRHRAGVGISEATDSLTVIVSEETGKVSVAYEGQLERGLTSDELKERLQRTLNRQSEEKQKGKHIWKGRSKAKNEKENIS
ncbi:MAG: diadenylate cyclase CdaA [Firmicutes bacterium]|nr:diadenylate cyclase CdaA [Bacillota bacterium]